MSLMSPKQTPKIIGQSITSLRCLVPKTLNCARFFGEHKTREIKKKKRNDKALLMPGFT